MRLNYAIGGKESLQILNAFPVYQQTDVLVTSGC